MEEKTTHCDRHLFIAGTGRAGTSFLVRFLTEAGMDTTLRRHGAAAFWDEEANAGLEDMPVPQVGSDLPYVIKSPWLYQYIDTILAAPHPPIDHVVIPIRDLTEAVSSRCILERRAIHEEAPWLTDMEATPEEWASTPGGIVYSLNPLDQGRLLAVGLHHLLQRLVAADIPVTLLSFPRLVNDPGYLVDRLRPLLPASLGRDGAIAAHQRVVAQENVRVGEELRSAAMVRSRVVQYESGTTLDTVALRRETSRLRRDLQKASLAAGEAEARSRQVGEQLRDAHDALRQAEAATEAMRQNAAAQAAQLSRNHEVMARLSRFVERVAAARIAARDDRGRLSLEKAQAERDTARLSAETTDLRQTLRLLQRQGALLREELDQVHRSRSWRLMRPYRAIGRCVGRLLHPVSSLITLRARIGTRQEAP